MLVDIKDKDALSRLSILSLRSYLNSRRWHNEGPWGSRPATIYSKEHGGRSWELLVPLRDTLADYAESMAETVAVLATVEERSQLDVFQDLIATGGDVIRMRSLNGMGREPLSLRQGADLLNDAYNMLAAGARAAERPQATYRGKMSSDVAEFLDNVRPMSSYYEGYTLTLYSPVQAGLIRQEDMGDEFHTPFPRAATKRLAQALEHASTAVQKVFADDTLDSFKLAVPHGVSANLCDSVADLANKGRGVEIDLIWSDLRPLNAPDSRFQFSINSADILAEAARSFRRDEPSYDEQIRAQVFQLDREPQEFDGNATILSVRDGRLIRIRVKFDQAVYNTVIRAFQEHKTISLDGDIYPDGNRYELRNPRSLCLVTE